MDMLCSLATDTPAYIEAELLAALRRLSAAQKLALARDMNQMADRLALAGILRRQPAISLHEQGYALALQRLTPEQRRPDRQWRDVQAILRVQGNLIDQSYLHRWARELGIVSLLACSIQGQPPPQSGAEPRQQHLF